MLLGNVMVEDTLWAAGILSLWALTLLALKFYK
jgi:hypothetical protein